MGAVLTKESESVVQSHVQAVVGASPSLVDPGV